jgi:hypothetical protein
VISPFYQNGLYRSCLTHGRAKSMQLELKVAQILADQGVKLSRRRAFLCDYEMRVAFVQGGRLWVISRQKNIGSSWPLAI